MPHGHVARSIAEFETILHLLSNMTYDTTDQENYLNYGKTRFKDAHKILGRTIFLNINEEDILDEILNNDTPVLNKIENNLELIKYIYRTETHPQKKPHRIG